VLTLFDAKMYTESFIPQQASYYCCTQVKSTISIIARTVDWI